MNAVGWPVFLDTMVIFFLEVVDFQSALVSLKRITPASRSHISCSPSLTAVHIMLYLAFNAFFCILLSVEGDGGMG